MTTVRSACGVAFAIVLGLAPAAGATVADDLCTGDPCVLSRNVVADPGSVLDFGTRTFRIAKGGSLTWDNHAFIYAGSCDFQTGSKIAEGPKSPANGYIFLKCGSSTVAGKIQTRGAGIWLQGDGPHTISGQMKVQGPTVMSGGVLTIDAYGPPGDITVSGQMIAQSSKGDAPGELRILSNWGNILVTEKGNIRAQGPRADPFYNLLDILAYSGSLTINGQVHARGTPGAYAVNLEGNLDVAFGPKAIVDAVANGQGAKIAINSQLGKVTVQGKIQAPVSKVEFDKGAHVGVCAASDILIDGGAKIDTSDASSNGSIVLGAFGTAQVGADTKGAKLFAKKDGDIEVCGNAGADIMPLSTVKPDPVAVGSGMCLSPTSWLSFFMDCSQ